MRVVFSKTVKLEEGKRRFRKGSVAWGELDGAIFRVRDSKDGQLCHVPAKDVRSVDFTRPPFGFMANRDGADFRFSPDSVERSVEAYLDKLCRTLSTKDFSPSPSEAFPTLLMRLARTR